MSKRKVINLFLVVLIIIEIIFVAHFKIVIGSGLSMYPTINEHQVLFCEYEKDYNLNDIVLYRLNGLPIVHRIVKVTEYALTNDSIVKTYTIKGDGNETEDMFEVYKENIVCKIVGVS